jgi:hypothetical protein
VARDSNGRPGGRAGALTADAPALLQLLRSAGFRPAAPRAVLLELLAQLLSEVDWRGVEDGAGCSPLVGWPESRHVLAALFLRGPALVARRAERCARRAAAQRRELHERVQSASDPVPLVRAALAARGFADALEAFVFFDEDGAQLLAPAALAARAAPLRMAVTRADVAAVAAHAAVRAGDAAVVGAAEWVELLAWPNELQGPLRGPALQRALAQAGARRAEIAARALRAAAEAPAAAPQQPAVLPEDEAALRPLEEEVAMLRALAAALRDQAPRPPARPRASRRARRARRAPACRREGPGAEAGGAGGRGSSRGWR